MTDNSNQEGYPEREESLSETLLKNGEIVPEVMSENKPKRPRRKSVWISIALSAILVLALGTWGVIHIATKYAPSQPEAAVSEYFSAMANPKLSSDEAISALSSFQEELSKSLSDSERTKMEESDSFDGAIAAADDETKTKLLKIVKDADSAANSYDDLKLTDDEKISLHLVSIALTEGIRMAAGETLPSVSGAVTINDPSTTATLDLSKVTFESDLWEVIIPDFLPSSLTLEEVDGTWKLSGTELLKHWNELLKQDKG